LFSPTVGITWEWVLATAIAAFLAALLGGASGWWLQRGAQLRQARVRIYEDHLSPFHDRVNDTRVEVESTKEPANPDRLRADFPSLARAATIASWKDRAWMMPVWGRLERIAKSYRSFQDAVAGVTNVGGHQPPTYREYADEALPLWTDLNEYLWKYRGWLEWKFTRRGPWPLRPNPPIRDPDATLKT
jgi:hypothetical protein